MLKIFEFVINAAAAVGCGGCGGNLWWWLCCFSLEDVQ
jgi:hypothetical protein